MKTVHLLHCAWRVIKIVLPDNCVWSEDIYSHEYCWYPMTPVDSPSWVLMNTVTSLWKVAGLGAWILHASIAHFEHKITVHTWCMKWPFILTYCILDSVHSNRETLLHIHRDSSFIDPPRKQEPMVPLVPWLCIESLFLLSSLVNTV